MTAAPQRKRDDPLSTVLFDLENLREDIHYLLNSVSSFQTLDKMAQCFIVAIRKAKLEQSELYPKRKKGEK
jgi:hypothetical protein